MMADTDRPEQQIDVMDGSDIDPELGRSLSVGELQLALRAAHTRAPQRVRPDSGNDSSRDVNSLRDSHSQSSQRIRGRQTSPGPDGTGGALSRALGLQNVGLLLAVRRERRIGHASADWPKAPGAWSIPHAGWAGSFYAHARRWVLLAVAVMMLVVGAVTVAGRLVAMVNPSPVVVAPTPRVSDLQFAGAAQAAVVDYLSWDGAAPRAARTAALNRWGLGEAVSDGWDASGQLNVENSVAIAVLRTADDQAVVTIQARTAPSSPTQATTNSSSPATAVSAMWWSVAVPVALRGSRIVLTAAPALVGSPPDQALGAAVASAADEDTDTGRATLDTVSKLITAYGSGDLEFVRGPGSTFTGLAGMVTGGQVQSWRMAKIGTGDDPSLRSGDVTVLWSLRGSAGQLRCGYRIQLVQRENRWLLQQITPEVDGP